MHFSGFAFVPLITVTYAVTTAPERSSLVKSLRSFANPYNPYSPVNREEGSDDAALFRYKSRPDLRPPKWDITVFDQDALAPGYWFVAPYANLDQIDFPHWNGPHIYDGSGELIWSGVPMFNHYNTFDLRTVDINGEKMLSLIYPQNIHESGVILNDRYEIETTVDLLGDFEMKNMHDFTVVDNGRRALTLTTRQGNSTREEAATVGLAEECSATWDGFKELDVETSHVLYEWDSHGNIGLNESTKIFADLQKVCADRWDNIHFNSIDKFPDGDYLVSARHTDAIYKISHDTGAIVWRLGGVKSNFTIGESAQFTRQHHARVHEQNKTHILISLFDNAKGDGNQDKASNDLSRGLKLSLNTDSMTAHLVQHYDHPNKKITNSRGSLHFLPNSNAFLGWTYSTLLSEHSQNGTLLMKANLIENGANNYRAYKLPWVGRPSDPPDVYVSLDDGANSTKEERRHNSVYVSWNGATEVAMWKLYGSDDSGTDRELIASTERQGFETKLEFDGHAEFVMVEAITADGKLLGSSDVKQVSLKLRAKHSPWPATVTTIFSLGAVTCVMIFVFWNAQWLKMRLQSALKKLKAPKYARLDGSAEEDPWIEAQLLRPQSRGSEEDADEAVNLDSKSPEYKEGSIS